eukprot:767012-Hanusia_phi.AAC.5
MKVSATRILLPPPLTYEMQKLGITIASPGFSIEPCPQEWFSGKRTGVGLRHRCRPPSHSCSLQWFIIGNVTRGSSAEKVGFTVGQEEPFVACLIALPARGADRGGGREECRRLLGG